MKKLLTFSIALLSSLMMMAQTGKLLPSVKLKDLSGKTIDISQFKNDGKPIIISFWATWCKPCKAELNAIAEEYEDWQDETGVTLIAVSIDDARSMSKVAPYVNSADWDYEVYLDPNRELARSLNVSTVPHTFLLNGKGKIVWEHKGYIDGDEDELYEQIEHLVK